MSHVFILVGRDGVAWPVPTWSPRNKMPAPASPSPPPPASRHASVKTPPLPTSWAGCHASPRVSTPVLWWIYMYLSWVHLYLGSNWGHPRGYSETWHIHMYSAFTLAYSRPSDLRPLHLTFLSSLRLAIEQHSCYVFNLKFHLHFMTTFNLGPYSSGWMTCLKNSETTVNKAWQRKSLKYINDTNLLKSIPQ